MAHSTAARRRQRRISTNGRTSYRQLEPGALLGKSLRSNAFDRIPLRQWRHLGQGRRPWLRHRQRVQADGEGHVDPPDHHGQGSRPLLTHHLLAYRVLQCGSQSHSPLPEPFVCAWLGTATGPTRSAATSPSALRASEITGTTTFGWLHRFAQDDRRLRQRHHAHRQEHRMGAGVFLGQARNLSLAQRRRRVWTRLYRVTPPLSGFAPLYLLTRQRAGRTLHQCLTLWHASSFALAEKPHGP